MRKKTWKIYTPYKIYYAYLATKDIQMGEWFSSLSEHSSPTTSR